MTDDFFSEATGVSHEYAAACGFAGIRYTHTFTSGTGMVHPAMFRVRGDSTSSGLVAFSKKAVERPICSFDAGSGDSQQCSRCAHLCVESHRLRGRAG